MTEKFQEFSDTVYTDLRRRLLSNKGSDVQRKFLQHVKDDQAFIDFMDNQVDMKLGDKPPLYPEQITESMFKDSPTEMDQSIFELLPTLPRSIACRSTFWGAFTLQHIRKGLIHASFLAANGGGQAGGAERIDRALEGEARSEKKRKEIDGCVRTVLRRMSGLQEARGNRSVYTDCSFGCAWWRGMFAQRLSEKEYVDYDSVARLLHISKTYWERLITVIVSRNSVVGATVVQDALIAVLCDRTRADEKTPLEDSGHLNTLTRNLSALSASRELGTLEFDALRDLIDRIANRQLERIERLESRSEAEGGENHEQ